MYIYTMNVIYAYTHTHTHDKGKIILINEHNMNTIRSVLMCMPNLPTVSHMFYHQLAIPKRALTKFLKGLH